VIGVAGILALELPKDPVIMISSLQSDQSVLTHTNLVPQAQEARP
jgi:hypothetical protein